MTKTQRTSRPAPRNVGPWMWEWRFTSHTGEEVEVMLSKHGRRWEVAWLRDGDGPPPEHGYPTKQAAMRLVALLLRDEPYG